MNWIARFVAVLLAAVAPAVALADTYIGAPGMGGNGAWTVYAFGNAQAVSDVFRALTNFSASSTFANVIHMIAVLGILGVGISSGFNPAVAKRFLGYIMGVVMVLYVFFGVNGSGPLLIQVEVIDTVDNTWKAPVTMPAAVGIPASMISTAGYELMRQVEASFPLPDAMKMSKGAPFNLAASLMRDASQAKITDPALAATMAYYVQDCFNYAVARGEKNVATLVTSTNFLADLKIDNKGLMVSSMIGSDGKALDAAAVMTCTEAYSGLVLYFNALSADVRNLLQDASAWATTPALSALAPAADSVALWASNNTVSGGATMIKQAAVLSAYKDAHKTSMAATGNGDFLDTVAMTQAIETQRASWVTGAAVFTQTMGYIYAILQVFVYGITPLILCAALIPGLGFSLMKSFMQILLWLAIWPLMAAIVNFIIVSMQQPDLVGAFGSGFTLASIGAITNKASNMSAAASFVGTMVPALAWAMVKGTVDISRVVGSAVGENFAQSAASTKVTGNYSLNQGAMDSFTANKRSVSSTTDAGWGHKVADGVGSSEFNAGGPEFAKANGVKTGMTGSQAMGSNVATNTSNAVNKGASSVESQGNTMTVTLADGSTLTGSTAAMQQAMASSAWGATLAATAGMNKPGAPNAQPGAQPAPGAAPSLMNIPGVTPTPQQAVPIESKMDKVARVAKAVTPSLNANLNTGVQTSNGTTANSGQNTATTESAQTTEAATRAKQFAAQHGLTYSAAKSEGVSNNRSVNATFEPTLDMMGQMAQLQRYRSDGMGVPHAPGAEYTPSTPSSSLKPVTWNEVQTDFNKKSDGVGAELKVEERKLAQDKAAAAAKQAELDDAAKKREAEIKQAAKTHTDKSNADAGPALIEQIGKRLGIDKETAADVYNRMKAMGPEMLNGLSAGVDSMWDTAKTAAQSMGIPLGAPRPASASPTQEQPGPQDKPQAPADRKPQGPADRNHQAPTDGKQPAAVESRAPGSADRNPHTPADGKQPSAVESRAPGSADRSLQAPTGARPQVAVESRGPGPVEHSAPQNGASVASLDVNQMLQNNPTAAGVASVPDSTGTLGLTAAAQAPGFPFAPESGQKPPVQQVNLDPKPRANGSAAQEATRPEGMPKSSTP